MIFSKDFHKGRFKEIIGSNISYIGKLLDSVFNSTQKVLIKLSLLKMNQIDM